MKVLKFKIKKGQLKNFLSSIFFSIKFFGNTFLIEFLSSCSIHVFYKDRPQSLTKKNSLTKKE